MKTSRKLRSALLALIAFCALAALGPAQSQAGEFTAAEYPATITGQNVGVHELTTEIGVMECEMTFDGPLVEPSETLTVVPTYGTGCTIEGLMVHVSNNGCDFLLHAGETLGEHEVGGTMDIQCPVGNAIDFEITAMMFCHLTVPAQEGLAVKFQNSTMFPDAHLNTNVQGLTYRLDPGCPVVGNYNNGTYTGTTTVKADHGGMGTGFAVY
ncbi:MAG TPA: hypothetical protein VFM51_08420 [Solirubrobacterales bacterium]|nr:hypothetical protein [Solirubrobacterales bacterium]